MTEAALIPAKRRSAWVGVALLAVFGVLFAKLFILQVIGGGRMRTIFEHQQQRPLPLALTPVGLKVPLAERPERGPIVDRTGRMLASSYCDHRLYYDPTPWSPEAEARAKSKDPNADDVEDLCAELPDLLKSEGVRCDPAELSAKLHKFKTPSGRTVHEILLATGITPAARRRLTAAFHEARWKGLAFRDLVAREYPCGEATAQMIGVVAESEKDQDGSVAGRTGLEWQLDALLTGRRGAFGGEKDSMGREFRFADAFAVPPVGGAEVILTIDAEISRFCLEALARNAKANPCVRSSAVVIGAQTGEILAAVSYPASPATGAGFNAKHLQLAAVSDSYEPGSTIKPVVVGWALEKGVIQRDQLFDCGGASATHMFWNRPVTEYSVNPEPLTPSQILWRSSNIGATRIGLECLKLPGLFEAFRAFHVADRPKSGLPNEAAGYYTPEHGDPAHGIAAANDKGAGVSFPRGYEVRLSPLGLALIYTTFATGGWKLSPTVIKEVRVAGTTITPPPAERTHVISKDTCDFLREAMLQVYENPRGTAHSSAYSAKYSAMGKTGTAQYMDRGTERGKEYNAWIVGMAPAKSKADPAKTRDPEIIVVVIHHRVPNRGKGTYTGGSVSGPVVKEIIERTLEYLGVAPDQPGPAELEEGGR